MRQTMVKVFPVYDKVINQFFQEVTVAETSLPLNKTMNYFIVRFWHSCMVPARSPGNPVRALRRRPVLLPVAAPACEISNKKQRNGSL